MRQNEHSDNKRHGHEEAASWDDLAEGTQAQQLDGGLALLLLVHCPC